MATNNIRFDFDKNPELKSVFAGWEVGKNYELRLKFKLNEMDDNGANAFVSEVLVPPAKGDKSKTVEPDDQQPVNMMMGGIGKPATKPEEMKVEYA